MPCIILSAYKYFHPHDQLYFYRKGSRGTERPCTVPKVTELEDGIADFGPGNLSLYYVFLTTHLCPLKNFNSP